MADTEEYLSQGEFGRRTGRSQQAVSKLVRSGKIPTVLREGRTVIPYQRALQALAGSMDPAQGEPVRASERASSFHQLRTAQLALKVQEQRLDLALKEGKVIDRAGTLRRVFEFVRGLRDAIQQFPARNAAVIAAELGIDAGRVQIVLDRRLKLFLTELADRQFRL
jgi:hypothetical protein